ncbi:MAG TPA: IPT/TIG domain-containing protein, partial [Solirubrobacteraceae bacterium]|nr:IPT/TIG domain-containing protein [Solirubrobacteraceae bacterium]
LGTTSVSFGAMPATSFTVNSDSSITAVSPGESVGRIVIAVTTPYGESSPEYCGPKGNKLHCSVHDYFDYKELTVTGVSPSSGSTLGGTSVTISGAGFELGSSATTFLFGKDVASDVECISSTECTAVSPAHKAGTVDVRAQVAGPHTKITSPGVPADQFLFAG